MSLITITEKDFAAYINSLDRASFYQTPQMATLLIKRGYQPKYLGLRKNNQIKVAALLFQKKIVGGYRLELHSGPNTNFDSYLNEFFSELKTYSVKNHVIELIIKPYHIYQHFDSYGQPISDENPNLLDTLVSLGYEHNGLKNGYTAGEPSWHYIKDLSQVDLASLQKSFSKSGQLHTKRAQKNGILIEKLERDQLIIFKQLTSLTSERQGFNDKSLDYYTDLFDAFGNKAEFMVASINFYNYLKQLAPEKEKLEAGISRLTQNVLQNPDNLKKKKELSSKETQYNSLLTKYSKAESFLKTFGDKDIPIATALFLYTKQEVIYLFGGSDATFNDFYAPMLLQLYGMEQSIKHKVPIYNFLGIAGLFDGSDGVLHFKQKFNGEIYQLLGTFYYYPKPLKYKAIQWLKKLLGRQ